MFKKLMLIFTMLMVLCGCQEVKEPISKTCTISENDMSAKIVATSTNHERVTQLEAEMVLTEGALINYGFGTADTAMYNLEYINEILDGQESDGYEVELVYDDVFYVMKMKLDLEELSDEIQARLSIDVDDETFNWNQFEAAILNNGGSCQ